MNRIQQDAQLLNRMNGAPMPGDPSVDAPLEPLNIPEDIYTLKSPIEYGGLLISELKITKDLSPADMRNIDLDRLSEIGEISKSIAAMTKQPVDLIESLKMPDWSVLAARSSAIMGNFLQE